MNKKKHIKKTAAKKTSPSRPRKPHRQNRTPEKIWQRNPELIQKFLDVRRDFEHLCAEVEYILRKKIASKAIETSSISCRAKTLNSFLDKIRRKYYEKPFQEITDLAGVRVVCLYQADIKAIAEIVREDFEIVEDVDKLGELDVDQFGYGARHFIVRLGKSTSGARYDDLKHLVCEIQVRTVVQDAWAIIQHHMVYKRESQVPKQLQRKLNSLAGLFEIVDDQFERIRGERESYLNEVRDSKNKPEHFLENDLNLDSFREYLKWAYPERPLESWDGQTQMILDSLSAADLQSLKDVDQLLLKTAETRKRLMSDLGPHLQNESGIVPSVLEVALALTVGSEKWETLLPWGYLEDLVKQSLLNSKQAQSSANPPPTAEDSTH